MEDVFVECLNVRGGVVFLKGGKEVMIACERHTAMYVEERKELGRAEVLNTG